jgi:pimeloyl-ACP methyl ester carboxylesterase
MSAHTRTVTWARGYFKRAEGDVPGTQTAKYRLTDLISRGLIEPTQARALLLDAGLVDLVWEATWAEDYATSDDELGERLGDAQGYSLFIHGWTGNHTIWEDLPGMVVASNHRLVSIAVDHNGFGQARFVDETPALDTCNPPAAMRVMEQLVELLKIRRQPGETHPRVINFVGHSMGGAALFYLNPIMWRTGEETRYALAPALLLEDDLHRAFYTTLGIGIGIVNRVRPFELIEKAIKPGVVEALCSGSSAFVRRAHALQYDETPRGITARTFAALGLLNNREIPRKWDSFRVMLGHRDSLVGLVPMMDLLSSMEFPAGHIRVVAGTHYMFSIGADVVFQHAQNRELVVEDILMLHNHALAQQTAGTRVGVSR